MAAAVRGRLYRFLYRRFMRKNMKMSVHMACFSKLSRTRLVSTVRPQEGALASPSDYHEASIEEKGNESSANGNRKV